MANPEEMRKPAFVVSLDFELYWGVRDHVRLNDYKENLLGVRQAIPAILRLFEEYGIHATWATVGFLFCDSRDQLLSAVPTVLPSYRNTTLSPYEALGQIGANEKEDPYHFAPSLIRRIAASPHQEIATHTFSHFYCLEPEENIEAFRADLQNAKRVAEIAGVILRSLVFPRNQYREPYLKISREMGIESFRGNQNSWLYEFQSGKEESLVRRAARLLDVYWNLAGHQTSISQLASPEAPCNIPASRFLRPYSRKLRWMEPLRLRRIIRGLEHAARRKETYHLWWHPHNFGIRLEENLRFLKRILQQYEKLRREYGMESLNMGEVAARLSQANRLYANA